VPELPADDGPTDFYFFVLSAPAIAKPGFVHGLIHDAR
jgi:hypothetical protein